MKKNWQFSSLNYRRNSFWYRNEFLLPESNEKRYQQKKKLLDRKLCNSEKKFTLTFSESKF